MSRPRKPRAPKNPPAPPNAALVPVTPKDLGSTPRFVILHNAICRAASGLSASGLKLAAMAMALLPSDFSNRSAGFTFVEFCKALGLPVGGASYQLFLKTVNECMDCKISIQLPKGWVKYTWFSHSAFNTETGQAVLTVSYDLAKVLNESAWEFTKLDLQTLGKLQSRYAIAFYGYLMSFSYLAGKQGNASGTWYRDLPLPDLRLISGAPEGAYPEVRRLIENAVHRPIQSLKDEAGIEVDFESIRQGREVVGGRFCCKFVPKMLPAGRGRGRPRKAPPGEADTPAPTDAVPLPTPSPKDECTLEDKELITLKKLHPTEFDSLYKEALASFDPLLKEKPGLFPKSMVLAIAEKRALTTLKERYGIVK